MIRAREGWLLVVGQAVRVAVLDRRHLWSDTVLWRQVATSVDSLGQS